VASFHVATQSAGRDQDASSAVTADPAFHERFDREARAGTPPSMDVLDMSRLPPDPVVEVYKKDVDRTLFDRNLALSLSERIEQLQRFVAFLSEMLEAGRRARGRVADAD
jgi:hypothetical protein